MLKQVKISRIARTVQGIARFGLLFVFLACAKSPGHQVYIDSGCARCHGSNLQGGSLGPPLTNLNQVWNKETLARFLDNPAVYVVQDTRLQALSRTYRTPMPQFVMDEKTRQALVEFLLEGPK